MLEAPLSLDITRDLDAFDQDILCGVFGEEETSLIYIVAGTLTQLLLGCAKTLGEGTASKLLKKQSKFETLLYFHFITIVENQNNAKSKKTSSKIAERISISIKSSVRIAFVVLLVHRAWKLFFGQVFLDTENFGSFSKFFLMKTKEVHCFAETGGWLLRCAHLHRFDEYLELCKVEERLGPAIWSLDSTVDAAFWGPAAFIVFILHGLLCNYHLYLLWDKLHLGWDQNAYFQSSGNVLLRLLTVYLKRPQMFWERLLLVTLGSLFWDWMTMVQ